MISIVIPTLSEEKYLPILLKEIEKQNFSDLKIIVADAGSNDKTVEIAKKQGCKIVNGGLPAKGRNEGVKISQGELVLFLDADTVYLPGDFLKKLLREFKNKNLDVATFPIYPVSESLTFNKLDNLFYGIYNRWTKLTQNFLPHATHGILIKRKIHQIIGGFDEKIKMAEDHEYVRRAKKYGKFGFIEIEPALISARRFEKDGRLKTYLKYILAGLYLVFLGSIKSDIFKYRFNHYKSIKEEWLKK